MLNDSITPYDVWFGWLETACAINEHAAPERPQYSGGSYTPAHKDSPGADFNRRGSWEETGLFDHGWTWARQIDADRGLICRPDKSHGVSGSVGMISSKENGWPLFWCFSTSVPDFAPEQPYTRFAVYATLRHGGDYSAAARDLSQRGYGSRAPDVVIGGQPTESVVAVEPDGTPRIFRWMSELQIRPENEKWIWEGFLSRGGVTLFNALWKAGKSTLLSHLLRSFDGRTDEFLGHKIVPSRVLYISEEHEDLWAERRDALGIGDHVGMITREYLPFRGRSSPAEWAKIIGDVVKAVQTHRFDVVILDTISKLWPVREENDAGQVEEALMPLWHVTNQGAALMLVHHNRKSDGKEFTGSRGSGGLPAFVETIIEFRRNSEDSKDRKRIIAGGGRYKETPDKLLIELLDTGYVSHGDPDDMDSDTKVRLGVGNVSRIRDWQNMLLEMLPVDPMKAMTQKEIAQAIRDRCQGVGIREEDLRTWLKANSNDDGGLLLQIGVGGKAGPKRWCKRVSSSENEPPTP